MDGLADYSRNSGYTKGDVNLTWETVKFNYDRGRKFEVDTMDNEETAEIAFGRLAGEFLRVKVAPESDAFTFAQLAGTTGISKVATGATLSTGSDVMDALISKRLYKEPFTIIEAIDIFNESIDKQFEPCIVEATKACQNEIAELAKTFKKQEAESEKQEVEWWENYHNSMKKYEA